MEVLSDIPLKFGLKKILKHFKVNTNTQARKIIGVNLTDSFLMIPRKSISGIYFPTEIKFYSCQLCPRERCIGRKAPYDSKLAKNYR